MRTTENTIRRLANTATANTTFNRFNHCNAYISELMHDSETGINYHLIKSYNTIVGVVNLNTLEVIEIGKYSRTTSKQFTQIHNQRFAYCTRYFIER